MIGRSPGRRRQHLAFVLAVLTSALVTVCGMALYQQDSLPATPAMFIVAFVIAALIITAAGILIGLPVTYLLSSREAESAGSYLLAGMGSGGAIMLAALLVDHFLGRGLEPAELIEAFVAGAIPGAVCAETWWFLYRRHAQSMGD